MAAAADIKDHLKDALKRGVIAASRPKPEPSSRILTYHSVGTRPHEMNVTPGAFAAQMEWLAHHAEVIPLDDAANGRPGVALTFDDGYEDNLLHAAPILSKHALPATVFAVTGRMGAHLGHDTHTPTSRLLTWDQLRELEALGWTIGAHTRTHPRLATLTAAQQHAEIAGAMADLRQHLGQPITAFAYPYGSALDYNGISRQCVRDAGFHFAVSNRYGVNTPNADPWALRRIWIDRTDTLATFQAKVDGRLDALGALDTPFGIRARRLVNRLLRSA